MVGWVSPTPKLLNEEIRATNHRLEIDNDNFTFTFIQDLPEEFSIKLSKDDYYEDKEYAAKDFKKRIAEQKRWIFKTRKDHGSSLGDEEFNIIHGLKKESLNQPSDNPILSSIHEDQSNLNH